MGGCLAWATLVRPIVFPKESVDSSAITDLAPIPTNDGVTDSHVPQDVTSWNIWFDFTALLGSSV